MGLRVVERPVVWHANKKTSIYLKLLLPQQNDLTSSWIFIWKGMHQTNRHCIGKVGTKHLAPPFGHLQPPIK